jgi:hypothetical protein
MPKPFAIALLPADPRHDDEYTLAIEPACTAAGAYVERVSAALDDDSVLQRIHNQLAKADLVVSEMTGRDATVFYETGYAHALGKPVVMLTRNIDEIPFDLMHYPHIEYDGLVALKDDLERRLRHLIETSIHGDAPPYVPVDVTVNGVKLAAGVTGDVPISRPGIVEFYVVVRNHAGRRVKPVDIQIGLITPAQFEFGGIDKVVPERLRIEGDARLQIWRTDLRILPGLWEKFWLHTRVKEHYAVGDPVGAFVLRIFTVSGFVDFPFNVTMAAVAGTYA